LGQDEDEISHTMPIRKELPKEHYIIKHNGEYKIFDSKDDMPPEIRDSIEKLEGIESMSSTYNVIVDGQRMSFKSYSEVPEHIKKAIGKV